MDKVVLFQNVVSQASSLVPSFFSHQPKCTINTRNRRITIWMDLWFYNSLSDRSIFARLQA